MCYYYCMVTIFIRINCLNTKGDYVQQQIKSRQRVTEHGEVFTAEREVKAMCDLVKQETERIDSRFLEIKTRYLIQRNAA